MNIQEQELKFLQSLSPDGGFLQSEKWLAFQESVGRPVTKFAENGFIANAILHSLPIVGNYWYVPRGPVMTNFEQHSKSIFELIRRAKEQGMGWIRIEPIDENALRVFQNALGKKLMKAPYDIQPKEIFVIDIEKSEEDILAAMKSKTRYNIGLAQKRGVVVHSCSIDDEACRTYTQNFLALTKEMAQRQGITTHSPKYYQKMIKMLGGDILKLYAAEYAGKIIAANLVLTFGTHATYLHGASSNEFRNAMAPYLLQWHAIRDAKAKGCKKFDFGGIKSSKDDNTWAGITNFKLGFCAHTKPIEYPGAYDIIVNPQRYAMYRGLQKAKMFIKKIGK